MPPPSPSLLTTLNLEGEPCLFPSSLDRFAESWEKAGALLVGLSFLSLSLPFFPLHRQHRLSVVVFRSRFFLF